MALRNRRSTGKLKGFDWELGTGFITPDGGGEDVFVQRSSIMPGDLCNLAEDQAVEFSVSWAGGNPKAIDVTSGGGGGGGGGGGSHYDNREKGRFDKECLSLNGPPIVIDISSSTSEEDEDEEEEEDEEDEEDEDEDEEEKEVNGNESPQSSSMTIKTKEERKQEEEECCILGFDPFQPPTVDFKDKLALSDWHPSNIQDDDISVIAERGKVACRDYPHSRHLCVKYPFDKTDHESFCLQCYCFVCDAAAPCKFWKGSIGHCHASDQDQNWKGRRMAHRGILADKFN